MDNIKGKLIWIHGVYGVYQYSIIKISPKDDGSIQLSISNKMAIIHDIISHESLGVLIMSVTWHETSDPLSLRHAIPPGFKCIDVAQ